MTTPPLGRLDTTPKDDEPDPDFTEQLAEDARATAAANAKMLARSRPGLFLR